MKLLSHAINLAYYASIMLDALSCLLCPKLYWHNWYKPCVYMCVCVCACVFACVCKCLCV